MTSPLKLVTVAALVRELKAGNTPSERPLSYCFFTGVVFPAVCSLQQSIHKLIAFVPRRDSDSLEIDKLIILCLP